jgi:hypothetical protein
MVKRLTVPNLEPGEISLRKAIEKAHIKREYVDTIPIIGDFGSEGQILYDYSGGRDPVFSRNQYTNRRTSRAPRRKSTKRCKK